MLHILTLAVAVVLCQEPRKPVGPPDDDDLVVRGLPEGEILPLPERVAWDLTKAITAKTSTRERVTLAGHWRFAAVLERETPVVRSEMGWLTMPGAANHGESSIFDGRFRATDGLWRGKPLEDHPHVWAERDITITNDDALKWLDHRTFLVLRGPWAKAEIYTSQRAAARKKPDADGDEKPEVHVHVEHVTGFDRDGYRWCEITEQLVYPGTTQISLRLTRDTTPAKGTPAAEPDSSYIGLELWPSGPRVDSIRLRRDRAAGQIEATFELMRPKGFMLFPGPPVRKIPLTIKIRLDDAETGSTIRKLDHDIGTMPDNNRTVAVRIPWSAAKDEPPPAKARLRVRLVPTERGYFDEPFPLQFKPAELEPVQ